MPRGIIGAGRGVGPGLLRRADNARYQQSTVTIANAGAELTDYPVRVDVTALPGMGANFDNIRFKSDATELSYWRESAVASTSAVFWVKVPTIAAAGNTEIAMEWGAGIADASNGLNVFSMYDNFDRVLPLQATNAAAFVPGSAGFYAENIVFDDATNKYWWIFQDGSSSPFTIRLASCDDLANPTWAIEAAPVITGGGTQVNAPHLAKFGSTWYIFYSLNDGLGGIYCQSSSTVNSGYSATGITNPIVTKGGAGSWEERRVLEPCVFQIGETYYMLYMGESAGTLLEKVGLATAPSPIGPWTKYASNPVLSGDTGWWDAGQDKAADPFVFQKDGLWYVGITACPTGKSGWRIGFFTTTDFINYTPVASNPVLGHTNSNQFDYSAVLRGGIIEVGGVYYFPYAGLSGSTFALGMTTLKFNQFGLDRSQWNEYRSVDISSGIATLNASVDYLEGNVLFGPGYAVRSLLKFSAPSANAGILGFRDRSDTGSDVLELLANVPSGEIHGIQNVSADASTANLGAPGAYHIYEVARNGATNGLYSIDDAAPTAVTTQIPAGSLPVLVYQHALCDWIAVRKYTNPEPTVTIG